MPRSKEVARRLARQERLVIPNMGRVGIGSTPPRTKRKKKRAKRKRPRVARPSTAIQCTGTAKTGRQCKLRTKRGNLCWIHLKSQEKLRIKPSKIQGAGFGLYTEQDIKKKKKITNYGGEVKNTPGNKGYDVQLRARPPLYMDGSNPTSSFGRFANTCRANNKTDRHCKGNNAKLTIAHRGNRWNVGLKATKNIKKGNEVFLAYGSGFRIGGNRAKKAVKRVKQKALKRPRRH